jgi:hypothetical protein
MTTRAFATLVLGFVVAAGCGTEAPASKSQAAASTGAVTGASDASKSIAEVDPCSLLRKDEIQQQIEQSGPASQAAALKQNGAVWTIEMHPVPRGASRTCEVHWQASVGGDVRRQGDFTIVVTYAGWLTGSVESMDPRLPIPELGDEAYFVGGTSGPPYARVGDIAVGIENFPDTKKSRSGLDLLRIAVPRARAAL